MGTIEDVCKVVQDLVAPDLKAIGARLDALKKEMKPSFDHREKEMKLRFDQSERVELDRFAAAEKLASARQETLLPTMAANHATVMNILDMDKRLTRLESERKAEPQHA